MPPRPISTASTWEQGRWCWYPVPAHPETQLPPAITPQNNRITRFLLRNQMLHKMTRCGHWDLLQPFFFFNIRQIYPSRPMVSQELEKTTILFLISNKRWWILPICWSGHQVRVATTGATSASSNDAASVTRSPRRWSPHHSAMNLNSQPTLQKNTTAMATDG